MKNHIVFKRLCLLLLVIAPFGAALLIMAFFYGCQQNKPDSPKPVGEITLENLQVAYAKQVKYGHMYALFAQRAETERLKNMANLYGAIARSEELHATNHARLLRDHRDENRESSVLPLQHVWIYHDVGQNG